MNRHTVKTDDIFKAAYLYYSTCCELEIRYKQEIKVDYILTGESVKEKERTYLSGEADINPLGLKEAFTTLLTRSGQKIRPSTQSNKENS